MKESSSSAFTNAKICFVGGEQMNFRVCLAERHRAAVRKPLWSMSYAATVAAGVGGGTWNGWLQTMPTESLLSNCRNKANVCEQLSTIV